MDPLKEAFYRIKQDIDFLSREVSILKSDLEQTRKSVIDLCEITKEIDKKIYKNTEEIPKNDKKIKSEIPTDNPRIQTVPSPNPTDNYPFEPLKPPNLPLSTGNGGVPTDRQTNQQTDKSFLETQKDKQNMQDSFRNALEILNSLDNLKKEIRFKFKRLTEQEMLVFSTIYTLEEEKGYANYKSLSLKLNLTESSVRDHVGNLIRKGIPVDKKKINNKQIQLSISQNLKKIASLPTILQLREI